MKWGGEGGRKKTDRLSLASSLVGHWARSPDIDDDDDDDDNLHARAHTHAHTKQWVISCTVQSRGFQSFSGCFCFDQV